MFTLVPSCSSCAGLTDHFLSGQKVLLKDTTARYESEPLWTPASAVCNMPGSADLDLTMAFSDTACPLSDAGCSPESSSEQAAADRPAKHLRSGQHQASEMLTGYVPCASWQSAQTAVAASKHPLPFQQCKAHQQPSHSIRVVSSQQPGDRQHLNGHSGPHSAYDCRNPELAPSAQTSLHSLQKQAPCH